MPIILLFSILHTSYVKFYTSWNYFRESSAACVYTISQMNYVDAPHKSQNYTVWYSYKYTILCGL